MKTELARKRILPAVALGTVLLLCPSADVRSQAERGELQDRYGDKVSVFSGDVHVPHDIRQRGTVVCIGGDVFIEGTVTQDVVVILGTLKLTGSVGGQVTGVLSDLELRNAEVSGALVSVGGGLELENSTVEREMVNVLGSLDRDELSRAIGKTVNIGFTSIWTLLFWLRLFHKFIVFVLLLALVLLVPERIQLMGDEAPVRYVQAFFVGLLGYLLFWVVLVVLSFTVVGVPVLVFAFYVVKWMGIAAIFHAVGRRLGRGVGASLSVLGSVMLVFAIYTIGMLAPAALGLVGLLVIAVLKVLFFLLVAMPGVGLAILTRVGGSSSARGASARPPGAAPEAAAPLDAGPAPDAPPP